jgi:hypothetical protein
MPYDANKGYPLQCMSCGVSFGPARADDDIVMPFVRSPKTSRTDQVYRDAERGSEIRAKLAAEMTGATEAEMSGLKITDMKDNQREGDIAAKLTPTKTEGQFFQPNGHEYAAGTASGNVVVDGKVTTGIAPRAGASAVERIRGVMGQGPWQVANPK